MIIFVENEFFYMSYSACWEHIYVDINWGYQHFSFRQLCSCSFHFDIFFLRRLGVKIKKHKHARSADEWRSDGVIRRARFHNVREQNGLGWRLEVFSINTGAMWCDIFGWWNTWTCVRRQGMSLELLMSNHKFFMKLYANDRIIKRENPIKFEMWFFTSRSWCLFSCQMHHFQLDVLLHLQIANSN